MVRDLVVRVLCRVNLVTRELVGRAVGNVCPPGLPTGSSPSQAMPPGNTSTWTGCFEIDVEYVIVFVKVENSGRLVA